MKGKFSYHAERVEAVNDFKTVGVLILVGETLIYVPVVREDAAVNLPSNEMVVEVEDAQARGLDPEDILNYYIDRRNGITESFSRAETITGKTLDEIKQKALDSIRH